MRTNLATLLALALAGPAAVSGMDNGVQRTPMMGWMAWLRFRCNINCDVDPDNCVSERLFMQMADRMVDDGWRDLGYQYVSVDDCWQAHSRAPDGTILENSTRFPSGMKALGQYIHSKGLKFGMYTAMGTESCQGYPSFGCHSVDDCEQARKDVATYLSWGIDYLKVDTCKGAMPSNFNTTHPLISSWLLEGGREAGRPVLYHPSGSYLTAKYKQFKLYSKTANQWRAYADIQPNWNEVESIIDYWAADSEHGHPSNYPNEWEDFLSTNRPGVFQDPDALIVGNTNSSASCRPCLERGPAFCPDRDHPADPCICCGVLTPEEEQTQFVMWAMWAAPLEIGADLRALPNSSAAIMKNWEVIAVNQDPLGRQARRAWRATNGTMGEGTEIWTKPLVDGSVAVALLNRADDVKAMGFTFDMGGFSPSDKVLVRDLLRHQDLGVHSDEITPLEVPAHGVLLLNCSVDVWANTIAIGQPDGPAGYDSIL